MSSIPSLVHMFFLILLRTSHPYLPSSLPGEKRTFVNAKVGSKFTGRPVRAVKYGPYDNAVVVEVGGKGSYAGEGKWWREKGDELAGGFWLK